MSKENLIPNKTPKEEQACCHSSHKKEPESSENSIPTNPKSSTHPSEAKYTCPMHPEVLSPIAGSCPICGMALEPIFSIDSETEEDQSELLDIKRRFWIATFLSVPLLLVMFEHFSDTLEKALNSSLGFWFQVALATPVVWWCGWPLFVKGWQSIRNRNLNMFTLIALGVGIAYIYSLIAGLFPQLFPSSYLNQYGRVGVYFEAAAVITTLVLLGQLLELAARSHTSQAIKELMEIAPKTAKKIQDDGLEVDVPVKHLHVGDRVRVRPGEKIPIDGEVLEGNGFVDESMMTGEPMPSEKNIGSKVTGGSINQNGSFVLRVTRVGGDTLLAQIIKMVSDAQRSRAPIQRLVDIVSSYFVPAVILISIMTFGVWLYWAPRESALAFAIVNAVAVLIIACPCALGLATPMSIMVGVGRAAKLGILIKNAESLELFTKVDTLVVDKTGTLTEGKPKLSAIYTLDGVDENNILQMAACVETSSEHPLSLAIVQEARHRGLEVTAAHSFESISGKGVKGVVEGKNILIGNKKLMSDEGVSFDHISEKADQMREEGHSVVIVAIDGKALALIGVSDPIKESTPEALKLIREIGVHVVMLTGDNSTTANVIAKKLQIDEVYADVLPNDKADIIKRIQSKNRIVAMAGDGINDAPALSQAHVGIAMGTGTDVAMESAHITLIKGDLRGLAQARELSKQTMNNIYQNLVFAFGYNTLGIPVAAGVLYPFFGILLSPIFASAAMAFSSVSVIANALRLKRVKI